uniref:Uncharacterized protein n=1 Tax=Anguilla anguilla TaxID=7936 RepID=A0A0E9SGL1_ANGAN
MSHIECRSQYYESVYMCHTEASVGLKALGLYTCHIEASVGHSTLGLWIFVM